MDIIEIAPATGAKTDLLFARTIATLLKKSILSCPVGMTEESIETTWNAVKEAAHPRLLLSLPSLPFRWSSSAAEAEPGLELIGELVGKCAALCPDVEFAAQDATRSDGEFLIMAVERAISAGAKTITICDSAGNMMPDEFCAYMERLREKAPALEGVGLASAVRKRDRHVHGLRFASVGAGVTGIKAASSGAAFPHLSSWPRSSIQEAIRWA